MMAKQSRPEEWRPIPGLEFYEASNNGRVRSLDRRLRLVGRWGPMTRFHTGRILRLKPKPNGSGAIYWSFYSDGACYWQVNRVVCRTFHGKPPTAAHEAAHLDGDTDNNCAENLAWATPLQNAAHKVGHGTAPVGVKNGMARLTPEKVRKIIAAYSSGESVTSIAKKYKTSRGNIVSIAGGRSWAHLDVGDLREAAKRRAKQNLEESWRMAAARMAERGSSLVRGVQ